MHDLVSFPRSKVAAALAALVMGAIAVPSDGADSREPPSASFRLADEVFELHHAVAFRTTALKSRAGEEITVVVLTEEPVDTGEVAAAVAEKGNWTGAGHLRLILRFESDGDLSWGMLQGRGNNLQLEPEKIDATVEVGPTRVSGTLSQGKPSEFFDDEYLLEGASFDVAILETRR